MSSFWGGKLISGRFMVILGCFGSFLVVLGRFGLFWVILGHFRSFWGKKAVFGVFCHFRDIFSKPSCNRLLLVCTWEG